MLVLGIETSCDETSFAMLEGELDGTKPFVEYLNSFVVRSSIISSQIENHIQYGGIVPEIGARLHAQQIHYLFYRLIKNYGADDTNINLQSYEETGETLNMEPFLSILGQIDVIYVTTNPGLASALRVGYEFAKTLRYFIAQKIHKIIEIVEVNHLYGHIFSCFYKQGKELLAQDNVFPHLHLIVSGGNSQLLLLKSPNNIQIVGQTLDDAAGECMDKIGRMLGFPYPGGLNLAKVANLHEENSMNFPVSMIKNMSLNYSFSGLKTAVRLFLQSQAPDDFEFEKPLTLNEIEKIRSTAGTPLNPKLEFIKKVAISVQSVVTTQLVNKLMKGVKLHDPKTVGISGGVSANLLLRQKVVQKNKSRIYIPPLFLTGDNAIMIVLAGLATSYKSEEIPSEKTQNTN
jgi:N6-L-threonylcarbamoyladenine synthase